MKKRVVRFTGGHGLHDWHPSPARRQAVKAQVGQLSHHAPDVGLGAWFCIEIKRTNGRLEITYYPGGTLCRPSKCMTGS
jgi:hypothetical protein